MFRWTTPARVGWLRLHGQPGSVFVEIADARSADRQAFSAEQAALELEIAAVSAELSRGRDHAVAGDVGSPAVAHDVAHRACGARPSRGLGDVAVGCDFPNRNAADDVQHGVGEWRNRHNSPIH